MLPSWELVCASPARQAAREAASFQRWNATEQACSAEFWTLADGRHLLRFHGVADFEVELARKLVTCTPVPGSGDAWRGVFAQQVQPLLLSLHGEQVFHGGAVAIGDSAIAFLAPSGTGKSTLTTAFARAGFPFLGDDCLHLGMSGDVVHAHPQPAFVRLWGDSAEALGEGRGAYVTGSPKPRLAAGDGLPHCGRALPLLRVYLLGEGAAHAPAIEAMPPAQQLIGWTANAFVLDIKNPDVLKRNLQAAARLVREVPMPRLDYPRRYDALGSVVAAVLADLAG